MEIGLLTWLKDKYIIFPNKIKKLQIIASIKNI